VTLLAGNFGGIEESEMAIGVRESGASAFVGGRIPTRVRPTRRMPMLRILTLSRNYFVKNSR
jgi:hypothetical protein